MESNADMRAKTKSESSVPEFVFGKWIVYVCAVGNYGMALGLPFSMSVLFLDWQSTFSATRAHTAAIYSTNVSILFGAAIISGFMMDRFGARFTVLLGSCLACLGCIISSFATSINFLILSNGVLGGFGFCSIQLPSMTAVNMAFTSRYRSLAVSVCTCWLGLCSMFFPFLCRFLVGHYSWRTTLIIIGSLCLQTAVLGFLMTSYVRQSCSKKDRVVETQKGLLIISPDSLEAKEGEDCQEHDDKEESKHNRLSENVHSEKEISPTSSSGQNKSRRKASSCSRLAIVVNRLRKSKWRFLINYIFLLYLLHMCTCMATMFSFILMMMDFSRTKGFEDQSTGAFFLFLIFVTSLVGRLLGGALNLIPFLHSITLLGICGVVISFGLIVLGNVTEYSTIVGFLAMTGLGAGGIFGIYTKAVLDIDGVDLDVYPLALGVAGSTEAVFDFIIPVMIGYSVDSTGSYAWILNCLGTASMLASLALILTQGFSTYQTFKKTNKQSEDT